MSVPAELDQSWISCSCWALYRRVLKRYVEHGDVVPSEQRLDG
ncbi:MAG TPA: hypothetical protein VH116_00515 [Gemmatimonadales bacterium]|nr:hypothetical protein [Gemmatimonadales bacterium]